MRRSFLAAILLAPATALADAPPVTIPADRVLGVHGKNVYSENDWNGDGHGDLAVLVLSETRDAVGLYLMTSTPETGVLAVTEYASALLPYDAARVAAGDLSYSFTISDEDYEPLIQMRSAATGLSLSLSTNPGSEAPVVFSIRTSRQVPLESGHRMDPVCEIFFVELLGNGPQTAKVHLPDGNTLDYDPGPGPRLTDWHYTDLPAPCLP